MKSAERDLPRLFHAARELHEPEARAQFLIRACGDDDDLRARLESLLRADREAGDFLVRASPTFTAEQPGQSIGRYKLLQLIGEGGFGRVWMAEQREPVKRRVALKVIKLGMDTQQVIARFEAERQALALMDHPNIARVLDAGATETGRPFFVMELVKGVPILEYCDAEQLDTRARLELFTSACLAIHHAHQKGVIHRDVKPSNVLVTSHDGRPVPKVIDFGIAKATRGELTTRTLFTEHGQMIGTPAYMSPEQAEMSGLDVDTRTDVYSLGVLLYEMLTGTTPFAANATAGRGFLEMMRAIREDEPDRPSTRVSTLGAKGPLTARRGRIDARRLSRVLRGDLDWIVMRCLEKDRSRRYESASDLAADVQRHLAHEPVRARPPSVVYRARKLARRNRVAFTAATAIVVALVIGAIGTATSLVAARERAKELEQVARFQASELAAIDARRMGERLREYLVAGLRAELARDRLDPEAVEARAIELDRLLGDVNLTDVALESLDENVFQQSLRAMRRDFASQPLVEARLLQTLAWTLREVGLLSRAVEPQERALAIRRERLGADDADVLTSLDSMGSLLQALGRLDEAEPMLREVVERRRRLLAADDPALATSVNNLGTLLHAKGDPAGAEPLLREALAIRRRTLPEDDRDTLLALNNLGVSLQAQNRPLEAEPIFREALAAERAALGDLDLATLSTLNNLSSVLKDGGRLAEAEPLAREALAGRRRVLGDRHVDTLTAINNLGILLLLQAKLDEAEPLLRQALAGQKRELGEAHPTTLASASNLCALLQQQGRTEAALPLLREGLDACRRELGDRHEVTLLTLNQLGQVLTRLGRFDEAEPVLREVVAGCLQTLGPDHPGTITTTFNLGLLFLDRRAPAEAEGALATALAAARTQPSEGPLDIASKLDALARARVALARPAEAEPLLRESLALRLANEPDGWRRHATASALGECLALLGRHEEADPLLVEGYERLAPPPARAASKREALERLIAHYAAWNRPADAERCKARLSELDAGTVGAK